MSKVKLPQKKHPSLKRKGSFKVGRSKLKTDTAHSIPVTQAPFKPSKDLNTVFNNSKSNGSTSSKGPKKFKKSDFKNTKPV